jgi:urease accessory protein
VSKAYADPYALIVQVVNPTAGLFEGDSLQSAVSVEAGAALCVTTPGSSRVYRMRDGRAEVRQQFQVAAGASLEYCPAPLIPQKGSRIRQRTRVDVAAGGELFFCEVLAPGRVAHGECFAFEEIDWTFDLWIGPTRAARERFRLSPGDSSLADLTRPFPHGYFASCYVVSAGLADGVDLQTLREMQSNDFYVGVTQIAVEAWSIRLLGRDSVVMARQVQAVRQALERTLPALRAPLRKL